MSEKKKKKKNIQAKANRCEKCGFKIGGKSHEEGYHHKNGSSGHTGAIRRY